MCLLFNVIFVCVVVRFVANSFFLLLLFPIPYIFFLLVLSIPSKRWSQLLQQQASVRSVSFWKGCTLKCEQRQVLHAHNISPPKIRLLCKQTFATQTINRWYTTTTSIATVFNACYDWSPILRMHFHHCEKLA